MDRGHGTFSGEDGAITSGRRRILEKYQKILECVEERVSEASIWRSHSLALDLGITHGQLDRQLRHSKGLRKRVLEILQSFIDFYKAKCDLKITDEGCRAEIETRLDSMFVNLVSLLSTANDAPPSDDIARLSQLVQQDTYTQFDIRRVQDKFPGCDPKLQKRIGALNRIRRLRLQDAHEDFLRKIAKATSSEIPMLSDGSRVQYEMDHEQVPISTILATLQLREDGSETSSVTSGSDTSGYRSYGFPGDEGDENEQLEPRIDLIEIRPVLMPPIPKHLMDPNSGETLCPYCWSNINQTLIQDTWEEHVCDDVEPFMCTYGRCSQSYRTFGSRDDWEDHENRVHRHSNAWVCHDCDEFSSSADLFKDHLRTCHQSSISEKYLDNVTAMCKISRPETKPRVRCIFCGLFMTSKQSEFDHLAEHLLDLALFVLPKDLENDTSGGTAGLDDASSEVYVDPPQVEDIHWFQSFNKDEIIPLHTMSIIGRGGFTVLTAVKSTGGASAGTLYAAKTFYSRKRTSYQERAKSEAEILRRLRHVHIISVVGAYTTKRETTLIMYPVYDHNLADYLEHSKESKLGIPPKWFGCLSSALAYLQHVRIKHKNIKPTNIGIKGNKITITGFEISEDFQDEDSDDEGIPSAYTRRFAAPEVVKCEPRNSSADIFSLGCVFFEMLCTMNGDEAVQMDYMSFYYAHIKQMTDILLHLQHLPGHIQPVVNVCISMLSEDRSKRPSAQETLDQFIGESGRLGTLHRTGLALVGTCITSKLNQLGIHTVKYPETATVQNL